MRRVKKSDGARTFVFSTTYMVVFVQFFKKESNAVQGYVSSQISLDPFFPKLGWGVSHALLPSLSSLGAFVVHYRGHKHVRLRNLLPRGKKPFSFSLYARSRRASSEKKRDIRSYQIPFPASFPNLFFWTPFLEKRRPASQPKKWPFSKQKYYQKCIHTVQPWDFLKIVWFFGLKQRVVKREIVPSREEAEAGKRIKKIENDIIIMRLQ